MLRSMLLDVLLDEGIPVAFSEVEVGAALLDPGEAAGLFLGHSSRSNPSKAPFAFRNAPSAT